MQAKRNDTPKAILLVVAIVIVLAFVVKTMMGALNKRSSATPVATSKPSPSAAAEAPAPDILVNRTEPGNGPPTAVQPQNPFRSTVGPLTPVPAKRSADEPSRSGGSAPPPMGGDLTPLPAPIPQELQVRLEGVLLGAKPIAVVNRGGKPVYLKPGQPLAYGYRILSIRASGVQLRRKDENRWLEVGAILSLSSLSSDEVSKTVNLRGIP